MFPALLSTDLLDRIARWPELKRWERREIGIELRHMGLSYREIAAVIPVHKGTLSSWCSDIQLTTEQSSRLAEKRPVIAERARIGTQRRMRARRERTLLRSAAESEAQTLSFDPIWRAGVVAYWSEGAKNKELRFANSDPDLVRLFLAWAIRYLNISPSDISIRLHLHSGQDESERKRFWSLELGLPLEQFGKTYIKPEGTGHRKNHLYAGTAAIRVARSGAALQRVLGWIDALREHTRNLG